MQAAREKNPNLLVIAKTDNSEYVNRLGINLLIRELEDKKTVEELSENFRVTNSCGEFSKLGLSEFNESFHDIDGNEYKYLKPKNPSQILFDCSHDDQSVFDKYDSFKMALPLMALNCSSRRAIASTWGFDQLVKEQIDCIDEKRLYSILTPEIKQETQEVKEDFDYDFWIEWEFADKVSVAGEFNEWNADDIWLKRDENGAWRCTKKLKIDKEKEKYQYKFVINGSEWVHNHATPNSPDP